MNDAYGRPLCRVCHTVLPDQWRGQKCRECRRNQRYGISDLAFFQLRQRSDSACAICGTVPSGVYPDVLCIDHNHAKERWIEIRGLLCPACNLGIGAFKDDPTLLEKALAYLKQPPFIQIDDPAIVRRFIGDQKRRARIVDSEIVP